MIMLQKYFHISDNFSSFVSENQAQTNGIIAAYHQPKT